MKNILVIFMMFFQFNSYGAESTVAYWKNQELTATVGQTWIKQGEVAMYLHLIIEYSTGSKCNDAFVSVLTSKDPKMGKFISKDTKSSSGKGNVLNFIIKNQKFEYESNQTLRARYDNGVEFATMPSQNLIKTIKDNDGEIEVRLGETPLVIFSKTYGAPEAFNLAKENCIKSLSK